HPEGQVVDIAKPLIEERPDKAKYLSEYDSKVDRETKGKSGRDQAGAPASAQIPSGTPGAQGQDAPAPSERAGGKPGRPGPPAMREPARRSAPARTSSAAEPTPSENGGELSRPQPGAAARHATPAAPQSGEGGQEGHPGTRPGAPGVPGRPNLAPSRDVLERA